MLETDVDAPAVPATPLRDLLQPHWPAMVQRLGARWPAFEATVRQQAAAHGLRDEAALARFAGLCLTFGPGFEQRPEHEWALALLADARLADWVKLHQTVLKAVQTLQRRGGEAQALVEADRGLVDQLVARSADPQALGRRACDIEALDLRLLPTAAERQVYDLVDGSWQRRPVPAPASVRVDAQRPLPPTVCVLASSATDGEPTSLQVRQIVHGGCTGERHPAVQWLDAKGEQRWQGHEGRAVSWRVDPAPPSDTAASRLGCALVEETYPAVHLLQADTCGLRDDGVPLGRQRTQVWAYPADQWLFALQRQGEWRGTWPAPAVHTPMGAAPAPAATRVRLERDGQAVPAPGWPEAFDRALPQALQQGLQRLFEAWNGVVREGGLRADARLFHGGAALAWGWREGEAGLAERPLMRVVGDLRFEQALDLALSGEIELDGSRTRLRLQADARAAHAATVRRERAAPTVLEALTAATVRWRTPLTLDWDPVAVEPVLTCAEASVCSGAVVGEAGLRPRALGSGWQWFLRLSIEPVMVSLRLHDPVLGQQRRQLALLPAMTLVDWSVG